MLIIVNQNIPIKKIGDEEIQFTAFLSDYDPSLIFVMTYSESNDVTFLKVLKIYNATEFDEEKNQSLIEDAEKEKRTFSQVEDRMRQELI